MDVNEVITKKKELRKNILTLFRDFEAETKCVVTECTIRTAQVVGMISDRKVMDVQIKVEI